MNTFSEHVGHSEDKILWHKTDVFHILGKTRLKHVCSITNRRHPPSWQAGVGSDCWLRAPSRLFASFCVAGLQFVVSDALCAAETRYLGVLFASASPRLVLSLRIWVQPCDRYQICTQVSPNKCILWSARIARVCRQKIILPCGNTVFVLIVSVCVCVCL